MEGSIRFADIWKKMLKIHAAKPTDSLQGKGHFNCHSKTSTFTVVKEQRKVDFKIV